MDLNELIEAAADAWDEPTHNITIEVATKRVAIRAKFSSAPLFEKVAPNEPGRFVSAGPALRRAIALKFAERAAKLAIEGEWSQRNVDQCAARARILAERAEKLDPNYHEWVPTPVVGVSGEVVGHAIPVAQDGAA